MAIQPVAMVSGLSHLSLYAVDLMAHQRQMAQQQMALSHHLDRQKIGAQRQKFRCLQCCWLWELIYFSPQKFNKFD